MTGKAVVGVFETVGAAEQARARLAASGVAAERIVVTGNLMADGIAAEASGQSYEHQSDRGGSHGNEAGWARYNSALRTGACVLSVESHSRGARQRLAELRRQQGARITMERPAP